MGKVSVENLRDFLYSLGARSLKHYVQYMWETYILIQEKLQQEKVEKCLDFLCGSILKYHNKCSLLQSKMQVNKE